MMRLFKAFFKAVATRPLLVYGQVRSYALFRWTRLWGRLFFTPKLGVHLGRNVRIQKLSSISAERPGAIVTIGDHTVVYEKAHIDSFGKGKIEIGARCVIGDVRICARDRISIGARCVFSWNVFIQDFNGHPVDPADRARQLESMTDYFQPSFDGHRPSTPRFDWPFPTDPVILGDDIWFGANCTILPGAKIGSGSIVATGAVVTRGDYPQRSILAGNPARVVKTLDGGA
jgi:acetyltransferase-like isoleucine patch superfamily enzyme